MGIVAPVEEAVSRTAARAVAGEISFQAPKLSLLVRVTDFWSW